MLGRPVSTVRGWLRAFAVSAAMVIEAFTLLVRRDGPDPAELWPVAAPTPAGQAMSVVIAYAEVLAARFGVLTPTWQSAGH